jgi:tetratricopeptide (TPR) repeat protein
MRASLALGSLRVELSRPQEAIEFIQRALPFYEQGSFHREAVQAYMLLGSAQNQLGEVNRAQQTLRKAVAAADRLGDAEQSGNAHGFLAHALMDGGDFSEAIAEEERSIRSFANARGGLLSAFGFASLVLLESKAGLFDKSAEALANAESRLAQLEGEQIQLRRAILDARAQIAYFQGKWTQAARCARQGIESSGADSNANALLFEGLASVRTGQVETGLNQGYAALRQFQQKQLSLAAAEGTLMLAQALAEANRPADAGKLAKEALAFFEPLENWEAIWRCRKILGDPKAREALDRCAQILGPELFESYRKRPDLKKMLS